MLCRCRRRGPCHYRRNPAYQTFLCARYQIYPPRSDVRRVPTVPRGEGAGADMLRGFDSDKRHWTSGPDADSESLGPRWSPLPPGSAAAGDMGVAVRLSRDSGGVGPVLRTHGRILQIRTARCSTRDS
jgi:hypothetical protein